MRWCYINCITCAIYFYHQITDIFLPPDYRYLHPYIHAPTFVCLNTFILMFLWLRAQVPSFCACVDQQDAAGKASAELTCKVCVTLILIFCCTQILVRISHLFMLNLVNVSHCGSHCGMLSPLTDSISPSPNIRSFRLKTPIPLPWSLISMFATQPRLWAWLSVNLERVSLGNTLSLRTRARYTKRSPA